MEEALLHNMSGLPQSCPSSEEMIGPDVAMIEEEVTTTGSSTITYSNSSSSIAAQYQYQSTVAWLNR
jgi:hypothetical protein